MSSEQFSLLFYACMLIDAIGWFGFVALPRIRKLLSCKERADGIVEDVVEIKKRQRAAAFPCCCPLSGGTCFLHM